jgi:hypothetical protein
VTFSNFRARVERGWEQTAGKLTNALSLATASVTEQQLRQARAKKVGVTGSYAVETPSADGAEVRSMNVTWKLTLRALPARTVGIRSKR